MADGEIAFSSQSNVSLWDVERMTHISDNISDYPCDGHSFAGLPCGGIVTGAQHACDNDVHVWELFGQKNYPPREV
jgi:hypothetical protein